MDLEGYCEAIENIFFLRQQRYGKDGSHYIGKESSTGKRNYGTENVFLFSNYVKQNYRPQKVKRNYIKKIENRPSNTVVTTTSLSETRQIRTEHPYGRAATEGNSQYQTVFDIQMTSNDQQVPFASAENLRDSALKKKHRSHRNTTFQDGRNNEMHDVSSPRNNATVSTFILRLQKCIIRYRSCSTRLLV